MKYLAPATTAGRSRVASFFALLAGLILSAVAPLGAEPAWTEAHNSRARLLPGGPGAASTNTVMAGVQIQIEPGWKTYWRNPGDSGVPPRFDWSASRNVRQVRVLWPAPIRFSDSTGTYIGYEKEVVFPVEILADKSGQPVELDLQLEYAVCKDICIPVESRLQIALDGSPPDKGSAVLLKRYLKRIPQKASPVGEGKVFRRVEAKLTGSKPVLSIDVLAPGQGEKTDLFIEAPDGIYLPMAASAGLQKDGARRFTVDLALSGDPAGLKGRVLRFTLDAGDQAYETDWRVE